MRKLLSLLGILLLLAAAFFSGVFLGYNERPEVAKATNLTSRDNLLTESFDFSPFWKAWNTLGEMYVPPSTASTTDIYSQEMVWGAIVGMVESLGDPHTSFLPPEKAQLFREDVRGLFGGVGMQVSYKDRLVTVVAPLKGNPAEAAGVLAGDRVLEIDGIDARKMSVEEAVTLIRGPIGEPVELVLGREGAPEFITVSIVRAEIIIPTLDTEVIESESGGKAFKIELYSFNESSVDLFRQAMREFSETGLRKLIIDLRGNHGGLLSASIDIASWFLPKGKVVVSQNGRSEKDEIVYRSKGYDIVAELYNGDIDIVVLVDKGSASASEILAGALHEHNIATLVGDRTFGKGSVQDLVNIAEGAVLKVTIARWLTPGGTSISDGGLTPDFMVEISPEDRAAGDDPQLKKALEVLENSK